MTISIRDLQDLLADACAKAPELTARLEKAAMIVALHELKEIEGKPAVFAVPSLEMAPGAARKYYETGLTCDCVDYKQSKAPKGLCKHKLAVILQKRLEGRDNKRQTQEASAKLESTSLSLEYGDQEHARAEKLARDLAEAGVNHTEAVEAANVEIARLCKEIDDLKAAQTARKAKAFTAVRALFNALGDE